MKVEIITIGDEVMSGNVVDTNMAHLSDKLWLLGLDVSYHTAVREDPDSIIEVLKHAASRARIVVVTGGLGPTKDDMTLEAASKAFGKKLALNAEVKKYLEMMFRQRGRTLSEANLKQAYLPEGAKPYLNRVGTASGVKLTYKKATYYFLPGVPKEMNHLFDDYVAKDLKLEATKKIHFQAKVLRCFGSAES